MIYALKKAFMGYIGLLLNAPYKIDSMMGCGCGYVCFYSFLNFLLLFLVIWAIGTRG
jgi:hypothetical protein